jgi:hypothetical protein
MIYTQLLGKIMRAGRFLRSSDAERALVTCLEALGYLSPAHLVEALKRELPDPCAAPLELGMSCHASHIDQQPGSLSGDALERVQLVCAILGACLSPDLTRELANALPTQLALALHGREERATRAAG